MSRLDPRRAVLVAALTATLATGGLAGCLTTPPATPSTPGPPQVEQAVPGVPSAAAARREPGPMTLSGESARFEFDPVSERHLESNRTDWTGLPPGRNDGSTTVILPITGGTVSLPNSSPRGQIRTAGRAELSREGKKVDFDDLTIDLDRGEVDATLDGRRVSMFDLDLTAAHREDLPNLPPEIVEISGHLSDDARREVRDRLGTDLSEGTSRIDMELRLRSP